MTFLAIFTLNGENQTGAELYTNRIEKKCHSINFNRAYRAKFSSLTMPKGEM